MKPGVRLSYPPDVVPDALRVVVCGGRDYADARHLGEVLTWVAPLEMAHGGAPGADSLAGRWAEVHGVPLKVYPADWARDGRAAGPIRNARMIREFKPTLVVAFPGGHGTENMVLRALRSGVDVLRAGGERS